MILVIVEQQDMKNENVERQGVTNPPESITESNVKTQESPRLRLKVDDIPFRNIQEFMTDPSSAQKRQVNNIEKTTKGD